MQMGKSGIWQLFFERKYIFLAAFSLLYIFLPPFLVDFNVLSLLIVVLYTIVLALCLVIISGSEKPKVFHLILLVFLVLPFLKIEHYYRTGLYLVIAIIYGWTAFKIIFQILKIENVNSEVIMGAVGGYLLIGLSGSFFIAFYSSIDPVSFQISSEVPNVYDKVYFTFVTLTTLGYGDITPHTPQAKSISIMIALVGQIYLTILMAILVGKYLFNFNNSK